MRARGLHLTAALLKKGQVITMLIAYEPNSDVLTITLAAGVATQSQAQGLATVNFDANGAVSSIVVPECQHSFI